MTSFTLSTISPNLYNIGEYMTFAGFQIADAVEYWEFQHVSQIINLYFMMNISPD